ncbi:MAG: PAS-domain containing protein [Thalassobaculum sp.]|uniref:PAS domain-containing sensor histidine kinase n=2 Tax=Thalassobaculum sp. TaxID=2022740 RepID=UPI0032EC69E2
MLAMLVIIIAAGIGGIATVNIARSYASGGTFYATGHLNAVAALRRFAVTRSEEDYNDFRRRIHVPSSDRVAREILEESDIPIQNSYPFLIEGRNHPRDTPGIAWLFRAFSDAPLFKPAVDVWRRADREVQNLEALAERLHRDTSFDSAEALRAIDEINTRLNAWEDRFARELGTAARGITTMLYAGLAGFGVVLAALVGVLGYRTHRRLTAAQQAIRDREVRFRDVAEMAADWIWETDAELRFTYLSDRVAQVVGAPTHTLLGKTRSDIAIVEQTEYWRSHLSDLNARRAFQGFEYAFRHPTRGNRYFRINGKPIFDVAGEFVGYRGTGSDVTDEVTARREIAASNALLETTFETLTQGISVVDANLKVVAFNERFLELLGFPSERFQLGDSFEDFMRYNAERGEYGDVDVDAVVEQAVANARRFEPHVIERVRPDGTVLEVRGQPLPGGGFVTTYTDITELRRTARDLQTAKVAAETANHAKSTFLANMSHELRTPLNAVIGFSDLMAEERFGPLSARYVGYARDIRQSGEHLLGVINDILDITRVEAGKIDLDIQAIGAHGMVDSCIRLLRQRANEANITLRNVVPFDAPPIHADEQRLRQVVLNVIGNAVKFSHPNSEVIVEFLETAGGTGLKVIDQGIGMPAGKISAAFEPFSQLHSGLGRSYEGAGLGLPLVRRFMELHGGTIEIHSETDQGTVVSILFPFAAVQNRVDRTLPFASRR